MDTDHAQNLIDSSFRLACTVLGIDIILHMQYPAVEQPFTTGSLSLSLSLSSALALAADSWAPDPLGDESMPTQCWPDPKAMVDQRLKTTVGVELMIP